MIRVGSDFSGVGAFDQALQRLKIDYKTVYACDMDKYARDTYITNYTEPPYYPENVYNRTIPNENLDIYMTSPPCQSFSLAGKRKGEDSVNGVLFYNSHEFIVKNNPRYFIFENVKGLLSDANGRTFQIWVDMLGGKSVNGNPVIFPRKDATPYHIYHKVLNAKHFGVPQNRERVFIIGIRDDSDNTFSFPKPFHLEKRLKDVLEADVNDKFYLSDKMIKGFTSHKERHEEKGTGFKWQPKSGDDVANTLRANGALCPTDNSIIDSGYINQDTQASQVHSKYKESPTLSAGTHGYANGYVQVNSATKKGYEVATEGDSINLSQPNSETRRGRVGKKVAQTLDTACNQAVITGGKWNDFKDEKGNKKGFESIKDGCSPTLLARARNDGSGMAAVKIDTKIRRLTPRECFRLMDFPETFTWTVSDTQAYKQAGNSIVVNVLTEIIKKFRF